MRIIARPRRGGKTFDLVRMLVDDPRSCLVVATAVEKSRVQDMLTHPPFALSDEALVDAVARVYLSRPGALLGIARPVFVDNADWLLARYLGTASIDAVTVNEDGR